MPYYVRKNGLDTNDGLSPETAFLTVGKAVATAGASDQPIYVGAGVYPEQVNLGSWVPNLIADVDGTYTGDAGEVEITGSDDGGNTIVRSYCLNCGTRYPSTLQGFKLSHSSGFAVYNTGQMHASGARTTAPCRIVDCQFVDNGGAITATGTGWPSSGYEPNGGMVIQRCSISQVRTVRAVQLVNFGYVLIEDVTLDSTRTYGFSFAGGMYKLRRCTISGGVSYGLEVNGSGTTVEFDDGTLSPTLYDVVSGTSTVTGLCVSIRNSTVKGSCNIPASDPDALLSAEIGSWGTCVVYQACNGDPQMRRVALPLDCYLERDSSMERTPGNPSVKFAASRLPGNVARVKILDLPVQAGIPIVVTLYLRKDATYGDGNGGFMPTARLVGCGLSVSASMDNVNDTWQQVTLAGTPTLTGLADIFVESCAQNSNPLPTIWITDLAVT